MRTRIVFIGSTVIAALGCLAWPATAAIVPAASCSATDVQAAITAAANGDTVTVPAGPCTWTNPGAAVNLHKSVTLQGGGPGSTIITIGAGSHYTAAVLAVNAASAVVRGFTFQGSAQTDHESAIAVGSGASNFRITGNTFASGVPLSDGIKTAYAIYVGASVGLIDHNLFQNGGQEMIFMRGPANSWQTPSSIGGAQNVFIEDNVFTYSAPTGTAGAVQAVDANSNTRVVFRHNQVTNMKFDAHGKCTNTPARSARHFEVYENDWFIDPPNRAVDQYNRMELRGGTGVVFRNTLTGYGKWYQPAIMLRDYAYAGTSCNGYQPNFACPSAYPLDDQIGVGQDPKAAGSEPLYAWENTDNGAPVGVSLPAPAAGVATQCGLASVAATHYMHLNADYILSAKPGYTPYTYPHPLQGVSGGSTTPPPPTPPGPAAGASAFLRFANAFHPGTGPLEIRFTLAAAGPARLAVFDRRGRELAAWSVDGTAGENVSTWDGRGKTGHPVAAGAYLLRLEADGKADTRTIAVIR